MGSTFTLTNPENRDCMMNIYNESRIMSHAHSLGPCRKFSVKVPENHPKLSLSKERELTTCDSLVDIPVVGPSLIEYFSSVPQFDERSRDYALDFGSNEHVIPSVKNFVLENVGGEAVMSFFKTGPQSYNCNLVSAELSPIIAFAIALSSIQTKLCTQ